MAGLAVVGAAVTGLVMSNGDYAASTAVMAWAVALVVIALSLVAGGLAGRRAGIVGLFAVVALAGTLLATVVPKLNHLQGVGDRTWRPATVARATDGFGLGVGGATLDLSAIEPAGLSTADPAHVSASVGIGQLTVQVPAGVAVEVRSSVGAGDIARVSGFGPAALPDAGSSGVFVGNGQDTGHRSGLGVHRSDRHRTRAGPADRRGQGRAGRDPGRGEAMTSEESRRDPADQHQDQADEQTEEHVMTEQTTPIVEDDGLAGASSGTGATGARGAATTSGATAADDPAGAEGPAGPSSASGSWSGDPVGMASAAPVERRGPSVPTIVWGLLFGLVAAVVIVGQTSEVDLNLEVSAPLALLAAGVVLVVWGIAGLGRSRRTP